MESFNTTPLQFAYVPGRMQFPKHSLTIIVKGTFDLRAGESASLADEQLFPTGDELYPDDDEGTGGAHYENDFAPFKPRTDLLLVGRCYPPGGTAPLSRASFAVGSHQKTIAVIGDREWQGMMRGWTDPKPFESMEIRYENSFGGVGFKKNPAGKGHAQVQTDDRKKMHPLPNLEHPDRLIRSKSDRPDPACFGPLGRMWEERFAKVGSYKGNWKDIRFPAVAEDFDWRHFNAAPSDMQVEGYLRGDEEIRLENLRPAESLYAAKLPAVRVQAFLSERESDETSAPKLREVPMNLDTLWIDAESETLVLVWRGVATIRSEDLDGIDQLFITSGSLSENPASLEEATVALHQTIREYELEWGLEAQSPEESEDGDPEAFGESSSERFELDGRESELPPRSRAEIEQMIAAGEPLTGMDMRGLDLRELRAPGVDCSGSCFAEADLTGADLSGAILVDANLDGAIMTGSNLSGAVMSTVVARKTVLVGADLSAADLHGADLRDSDLTEVRASEADFENARLERSRLVRIQADGASFAGAILDEATLSEAVLDRADFTGASLREATLDEASLVDANWARVTAPGANLQRARLARLRATEGCDLSGSSFREAHGLESLWQGAILRDADYSHAVMEGADFSEADLENAILDASDMRYARFIGARLRGARLRSMNLFQGSLEKSDLTDVDLSGSNMFEVEFLDATFSNTVGKGANLKRTKQHKG